MYFEPPMAERPPMPLRVRAAQVGDIAKISQLLVSAARERTRRNPALWPLAESCEAEVGAAVHRALSDPAQLMQQIWLVAEGSDAGMCGVAHAMILPVPPIYAGVLGQPGLILLDVYCVPEAPVATKGALIGAVEEALSAAGAKVLLAAHEPGAAVPFAQRGYRPLTLYMWKSGLAGEIGAVRLARRSDLDGLVALSALHRTLLERLDRFWTPHAEADARFSAWMHKSLGLADRDMLVSPDGGAGGYIIAQPATRMHIPPAHALGGTGIIDDFHHPDMESPEALANDGAGALALLSAAEASFVERGIDTALVVCPAAWRSKRQVLGAAGYDVALVWSILDTV